MTPSEHFDTLIASLQDWRGPVLTRLRDIFHEVDSEIVEEWKYMGSPVWYYHGRMIVTGNAFKTSLKLGFLYGAKLPDPDKLFNTELDGNQRRGIKYFAGDSIDEAALKALIQAAIDHSQAKPGS